MRAMLCTVPAIAGREPTLAEAAAFLNLDPAVLDRRTGVMLLSLIPRQYFVRAIVDETTSEDLGRRGASADVPIQSF